MKILAILTLTLLTCCAFGQTQASNCVATNSNWVSINTSNEITYRNPTYYFNPPESTASDIAKVLKDFGVNVSVGSIASILGLVVIAARMLRKAIPDNLQTGAMGTALKHAALEINPSLTPTPPSVPQPAVVLKDQSTPAESKTL